MESEWRRERWIFRGKRTARMKKGERVVYEYMKEDDFLFPDRLGGLDANAFQTTSRLSPNPVIGGIYTVWVADDGNVGHGTRGAILEDRITDEQSIARWTMEHLLAETVGASIAQEQKLQKSADNPIGRLTLDEIKGMIHGPGSHRPNRRGMTTVVLEYLDL